MIFYPFEGAYPSSAFGTATPNYVCIQIIVKIYSIVCYDIVKFK